MPVGFEVGIPQSWAWTLLAPYISSCPANTTRLAWQNFPSLTILNEPNTLKPSCETLLENKKCAKVPAGENPLGIFLFDVFLIVGNSHIKRG